MHIIGGVLGDEYYNHEKKGSELYKNFQKALRALINNYLLKAHSKVETKSCVLIILFPGNYAFQIHVPHQIQNFI